MRRLDVRPLKKLRNPARHLRALRQWAETVDRLLPAPQELAEWTDYFWRIQVPIHSKLVSEPHTTQEIRRDVAQSILDAAASVARGLRAPRPARVACLIAPEDLFASEVTVFFDEGYFAGFAPPYRHGMTETSDFRVWTTPARIDLVRDWRLTVPEGLLDLGGYRMVEQDRSETGEGWAEPRRDCHHWLFAEAGFCARG